MNTTCGCCGSGSSVAPGIYNRPGLGMLAYRIADYNAFLESMLVRLSSTDYPQLRKLTTRDPADPAIALLDAWAVVGDVLTFYQERIANENFLRTATERFSVAQLAQLVGYKLRPGVAASTYLAFTVQRPADALDDDAEVIVPAGTRAQSIPAPSETMQAFESSDDLIARPRWNVLGLRLEQPPAIAVDSQELYVAGVTANLKTNDPLLLTTSSAQQTIRRIDTAETQFEKSRTKITLQTPAGTSAAPNAPTAAAGDSTGHAFLPPGSAASAPAPRAVAPAERSPFARLTALVPALSKPPAAHPRSEAFLQRSSSELFKPTSDLAPALLSEFVPGTGAELYAALANEQVSPASTAGVLAFRVSAAPFGNNAPLKLITNDKGAIVGSEEWPIAGSRQFEVTISVHTSSSLFRGTEAGISETGQVSASASLIATVSFVKSGTTDDVRESATVVITQDGTNGTATLGEWQITCTAHSAQRTESDLEVQFQSAAEVHRFTFARAYGALTGAVDSGTAHPLPAGQTIRYSQNNGRVTMAFNPPQLGTVQERTPVEPFLRAAYELPQTPDLTVLALDSVYDQIIPQSTVILERPDWVAPRVTQVTAVSKVSKAAYGMSGRVTQIKLATAWGDSSDTMLSSLRQLSVAAQSEVLPLAPSPVTEDLSGARIELDGVYAGLEPGRWLMVQGERTDIPSAAGAGAAPDPAKGAAPTSGVEAAELVMLAGVEQDVHSDAAGPNVLPGDKTHTTLVLASALAYTYVRATVSVYGNIAHATQGETRAEILGNGDNSQALQEFTLGQKPLTYIAATTPDGIASTLQIRVNDLLWQEQPNLLDAGPNDHVYATEISDNATTAVFFGDGTHGSRLASGTANVRAVYRSGIGASGNVAADQISQLASQPLGVKSVTNPQPSTGGADAESRDSARGNVSVALTALDRLVSIQDYADFSRGFAGVGKANAVALSDGSQQLVYITIAGEEDIPIATDSDLYQNLAASMAAFGDPDQPFAIGVRDVLFLVISARVTIDPAYEWTAVVAALRARLLAVFGFAARGLAQPVYRSEVIAAMQSVEGVSWVELEILESVGEATINDDLTRIATNPANRDSITAHPARQITDAHGKVQLLPAQLAYLNGNVPDTLILNQGAA